MPPKRRKRTAAARESPRKKAKLEIPDKYVKQQAGEFLEGLEIPTKKPPSENSVLHLLIASLILSARMSENISTNYSYSLRMSIQICNPLAKHPGMSCAM
jgi:hypothetical protein